MKLYLNKNPLLIEKYQQLLITQWNFETMKESLDLANSFLNSCKHPLGFSELLQNYGNSELSEFLTSSNFRNYLQNQVIFTSNKNFPSIPEKIPKRRSTSKIIYSKLTLEVIYNLAFPVFATNKKNKNFILDGEIGFLRDIQSLIFMLTSNIMLPLLKQHRLKEEINYLNLMMFTHSLMVWHDNPAHQNQLFSIVFDNMGFHEAVIDCLYIAFRLTLPDDHDYLTKAQAYWSALIDAKMFDKAKEFSLKLLRYSSEKHFEEIKEIIELTFELEHQ
ncbi:MAG: hypothetical protein OMM_04990 [Candidatus Magnetoglobus multicellularis str. Araruama]|uniref:Uncharacterized protein n=1 Tax=Candidatus Magnetoglobus multicellularis str. Araruama TaxID=890399 RepID=A0A1V1NYT0_9BACT|nr:MAG: hypothetical protein OMM_04990 [Candidatus Magnetoglobus multicellularis str. Araruama]